MRTKGRVGVRWQDLEAGGSIKHIHLKTQRPGSLQSEKLSCKISEVDSLKGVDGLFFDNKGFRQRATGNISIKQHWCLVFYRSLR